MKILGLGNFSLFIFTLSSVEFLRYFHELHWIGEMGKKNWVLKMFSHAVLDKYTTVIWLLLVVKNSSQNMKIKHMENLSPNRC